MPIHNVNMNTANQCQASFSVRNGQLDCATGQMGTLCRIICEDGFTLFPSEPNAVRCLAGVWDLPVDRLPSCTGERSTQESNKPS